MHPEAYAFVESFVRAHGPFAGVLEIGGRDVNGSVRPLFAPAAYLSIDVANGPGVDIVADAAEWSPFEAGVERPADCVVCCEVLEHAKRAEDIVRNARTWLKEGGLLVVTCATDPRLPHSAVDGHIMELPYREFYRNVSPSDFWRWADGFDHVDVATDERRGDLYAVARK